MRLQEIVLLACVTVSAAAQQTVKPKDVREIARGGTSALPKLQELLKNPDTDVRLEAVKQIVELGTQYSLEPLVQATSDNDPEVQIRATDGLVNFYYTGYVRTGLTASLRRVGTNLKSKFTDTNDQVVDPYIQVRPDVVAALGKLVRGGGRMDVRANAARALGVLRGAGAVPDLVTALHTKDTDLIYESLVALQKIQDKSSAPQIAFLMRDPVEKVAVAAIETTGQLQNTDAVPDLMNVLDRARDAKIRRATLIAIAKLPVPSSRETYARYLHDRDERMRSAAAEGYGRLKNTADLPAIDKAWNEETKTPARISLAFAEVMLGKTEMSEFSPLQFLVNTLNSSSWRGEAYPLLVEVARDATVRRSLYKPLLGGTRDERTQLAQVMARSGDKNDIPELQKLSNDPDSEVAKEGLRALRILQARLG